MIDLTATVQTNDSIHAATTLVREPPVTKRAVVAFTKPTTNVPDAVPARSQPEGLIQPTPPSSLAPRRLRSPSIKIAAQNVLFIAASTNQSEILPTVPEMSNNKLEGQELTRQLEGSHVSIPGTAAHRKVAIDDFPKLLKASDSLYAKYQDSLEIKVEQTLPAIKVEDVRKGAFTEGLADQYKHEMVRKVKRLSSMEQYIGVRTKVLGDITASQEGGDYHEHCRLPRKPKIPKPSRRLVNPKTKQPRPDRFNRKINRMMRKIWKKDHQLPVVEESLRDP